MDECLLALLTNTECSTDEIFAHQVQLQFIVHKISELSDAKTDSLDAEKAPLPFYLKAFRSQLLEFQRSLSPEAERNRNALQTLSTIKQLTFTRNPPSLCTTHNP